MKENVKLTKSQEALYMSWVKEFRGVMDAMTSIMNELLSVRIKEMADEAGINLTSEDWRFDAQSLSFRKIEKGKPADPTEEIKDAEIVDEPEVK